MEPKIITADEAKALLCCCYSDGPDDHDDYYCAAKSPYLVTRVAERLREHASREEAGQSAQEVAERYRELEGRYSETESDIASLTDALNGALRNAGLNGEQMQAPCLREMKSRIWLLSYAAVRGQQLAAQPGTAGRESDGQCEATAEQNRCPPSTPAATPREIPESVVEACVGVYYNEIGTPLTTTDGAMRAALNEYDRQMPALRGRVLGERWQVRFADGEVSERTHWSKESADVAARASGGTVHRVALVEMGEVDDG